MPGRSLQGGDVQVLADSNTDKETSQQNVVDDDFFGDNRDVVVVGSKDGDEEENIPCRYELLAAEACRQNCTCTTTISASFSQEIERIFGEAFSPGSRMLQNMMDVDDDLENFGVVIVNASIVTPPSNEGSGDLPYDPERPYDQALKDLQDHQKSCSAANDEVCAYIKKSFKCCCLNEITAYTECAYDIIYPNKFHLPSTCTYGCYESPIAPGLAVGIVVGVVVVAALSLTCMYYFGIHKRKAIRLFLKEPITKKHTLVGGNVCSIQGNSNVFNPKFEYGVSSMQGWRAKMEDRHIIAQSSPSDKMTNNKTESTSMAALPPNHALFCVMDGHGGISASDFASKHLIRILCREEVFLDYIYQLNLKDKRNNEELQDLFLLLERSLQHAFVDLDLDMLQTMKKEDARKRKKNMRNNIVSRTGKKRRQESDGMTETDIVNPSIEITEKDKNCDIEEAHIFTRENSMDCCEQGTTAVAVLLTPQFIICANVGDSRAVLCSERKSSKNSQVMAIPLSVDHKPDLPKEKERIERAGGVVTSNRIRSSIDNVGSLSVSRALGDFNYKKYQPLDKEETGMQIACRAQVSPVPEVTVQFPCTERDRFIVLACDGIWDVLSNDECVDLIQALFKEGESDIGLICEEVLEVCLEKGSRDNMSIILVKFPSQSVREGGGVAARRKLKLNTQV
eukprot:CAMPEP_0194321180 /NCGR_PEP_ID=MMETSP0171-20130528/17408_1 /TAXON_ID=218684 /ORGANISM="Corethron pennatum, Strain L29A3" /LENGTH=679 /DNA_ID=CAMNT_0039078967 /DNA_START=22 /DNA_END=2061 /DNA_ORIENTATION=-